MTHTDKKSDPMSKILFISFLTRESRYWNQFRGEPKEQSHLLIMIIDTYGQKVKSASTVDKGSQLNLYWT